MQILTSDPKSLLYEPYLSVQLYNGGHYLIEDAGDDWTGFDWLPAHAEWPARHLYIFQGTLKPVPNERFTHNYSCSQLDAIDQIRSKLSRLCKPHFPV